MIEREVFETLDDVPPGQHRAVLSAVLEVPGEDARVVQLAGSDQAYASSSDLRAEATEYMASRDGAALRAEAERLGVPLRFELRPRRDQRGREMAALRRATHAARTGK